MTVPTAILQTPYSSAYPLITPDLNKTYLTGLEQQRIASYALYERIYWTVPTTFKLTARGYEDHPIYVPTGRTIVETANRYTAPGFHVVARPVTGVLEGSQDIEAAQTAFDSLFERERFYSAFAANKRFGLIRGDWCWHITGDLTKPQGKRISIIGIDPGQYIPITDDDNVDKILGCHLISQITVGSDVRIHRLTYRKVPRPDGTNQITVEEGLFPLDKWEQPDAKAVTVLRPVTNLPPQINALPVYHIKNFEEPQNPFGSSEIRGFERIMAAVNQSISDEELALAMDGIGVYWTDAPNPRDPNTGEQLPWAFGPGSMITVPEGKKINRLVGVSSVTPGTEHRNWLIEQLSRSSGTPDVAVGVVDVQVAQSGIALALQLGPILARTDEKDLSIKEVHGQMMFDLLNGWFPAYESLSFTDAKMVGMTGDKVPVDRAAKLAELNDMLDRGVIDAQYYRDEATKLGYTFPADIGQRVADEQAQKQADPFGARAASEVGNSGGSG